MKAMDRSSKKQPEIVIISGLSGSGKSTVAVAVERASVLSAI